MKKILFMMLALVGMTANAQGIKSGSKWNISNLVYEAKVNIDNTITFTAMAEGEELAFRLTPNYSNKNEFVLSEELNADGFNPFSKTARAEYKNIAFNGTVTGVLRISGLTDLEGMWEAVQTLDGLTLYEVEQDEYGMFKRKDLQKTLSWVNTEPRFGYANRILLNDKIFRKMKKSTLRIMRNSILAKHGYMFSSRDLADYFASQPWFSPRPSNDGVNDELSLVERLNIELIKCEEAKADKDRYVTEP